MKETRFFYAPDAASSAELPADEANHALKVLRLKAGDELLLMDGCGHIHRAEITQATGRHCLYRILAEVGIDELSFLNCQYSERRVLKTERIEKIVVSAAKQSHKAWMPAVRELTPFRRFISEHTSGHRYIAHCYQEVGRVNLFDQLCSLQPTDDTLVLIGPEGDFSIDEVREAVSAGFVSVDLGESRLRTETAGLSAVMMMQLARQITKAKQR